jgi:hypothetical protein
MLLLYQNFPENELHFDERYIPTPMEVSGGNGKKRNEGVRMMGKGHSFK